MKRIFAMLLLLCCLVTLVACNSGENKTVDPQKESDTTEKPSNYDEDGNLISIDQSDPLVEFEAKSTRDIYEEDGMAHENSYRIPKLNVNLYGANTISERIYSDFKNEFGTHFAMLDDLSGEKVHTGEPFLTVDYSYSCAFDVVTVIVKGTYTYISGEVTDKYLVYYYDALTDEELTFDDYVTYCALSGDSLHEAVESDLTANHPESLNDYTISYITKTGDKTYDLYVTLNTGNMIVISAEIESVEFDMSMFGG